WINSFEAEQHLKHIGMSDSPVCWTLTGYASGYASAVLGREVRVFEKACVAKGDPKCIVTAKVIDKKDDEFESLIEHYKEENFHTEMQKLLNKLEERSLDLELQQEKVRKLESQVNYLQETLGEEYNFEQMIGASSIFKQVVKNVERVSASDTTVLIYGE